LIGWGSNDEYFKVQNYILIHPHDFLRLNWTPKVGEEVERVKDYGLNMYNNRPQIGERCIVNEVEDKQFIKIKGYNHSWKIKYFIPIYPRKKTEEKQDQNRCAECGFIVGNDVFTVCDDCWDKLNHVPKRKQKQEKPDAYIESTPKGLFYRIVNRYNNDDFVDGDVRNAYKYNILSESEYKAKYDKLTFKGWEVTRSMTPDGYLYSCGCVDGINENDLIGFDRIYKLARKYGVEPHEISYFLNVNAKTFGL
jgi:hypothetical protein